MLAVMLLAEYCCDFNKSMNTVKAFKEPLDSLQHHFDLPFATLMQKAQTIHLQHFPKHDMQLSTLLNIKTGACPEDCKYCSQSIRYQTGLERSPIMDEQIVMAKAKQAKANGSTRFCMGLAWRTPPSKTQFEKTMHLVKQVKKLGLETCLTMGMLKPEQALALKEAGLDYYNHNLDTSPEYYKTVVTTRTYEDRLETLKNVHQAGLKTCCGAILGMGESREDRIQFLLQLLKLDAPPQSIPINQLVKIPGTPFEKMKAIDPFEFVRTIAVARVHFPTSRIRLSAGRMQMSDELQALCFLAGANSVFYGDELLTTKNPQMQKDRQLLDRLDIAIQGHD
jgi:biotin synthase